MRSEERGPIREEEVFEAVTTAEVIESYEEFHEMCDLSWR